MLPRRRGLAVALLVALVGIEILTVAAVILPQHLRTNQALQVHTQQLLQDVVDETRENARGFMGQAQSGVQLTQDLFVSGGLSLERVAELERYFLAQLRIIPQVDGIFFGNPKGEFLFVKRTQGNLESRYVTKIIEGVGTLRRVSRIWRDESLNELVRDGDSADQYDPRSRPWYERAVETESTVWTDPYIFFTSRQPGVTVAARVTNSSGQLMGVVGADVELSALSNFLAAQQVTSFGAAVIARRNGEVLAYPFPEQLYKTTADGQLRLAMLDELDGITAKAASVLSDVSKSGTSRVGNFVFNDERFSAIFVPFLEQREWMMGVYAPESHFAGSIREGQRQSIVWAILISVLVTTAAFFGGLRLLHPLASLQEQADRDPLTGLLNRRSFIRDAERAFQDSTNKQLPLSLIMLDIDNFKLVNDEHGHQVGDEVLTAVVGRIQRGLSQQDLLTRHGGEEFAVLLPKVDLPEARAVAERLRGLIGEPPIGTTLGPLPVTISLGVASLTAELTSITALMNTADQRLLQAKRAGKNQVCLSSAAKPEADVGG